MANRSWRAPSLYKMFGGRRFGFDDGFPTKTAARKRAKDLRARGLLARLTPGRDFEGRQGYLVYFRRDLGIG